MSPMCIRVLRKRSHTQVEAAKQQVEAAKRQKVEADLAELMLCASRALEERQAEERRRDAMMKHQAEQEILLRFIVNSHSENAGGEQFVTVESLECHETIESDSYLGMVRKFQAHDPESYSAASDAALKQWRDGFRARAWNAHYDAVAAGKALPFKYYHD